MTAYNDLRAAVLDYIAYLNTLADDESADYEASGAYQYAAAGLAVILERFPEHPDRERSNVSPLDWGDNDPLA